MKKYNSEFKSIIVELYKTRRSVRDLSREYGVSEVTVYKLVSCPVIEVSSAGRVWIKQISAIATMDDTEITLEEIKCMKQEMLHLQEENEILIENLTL